MGKTGPEEKAENYYNILRPALEELRRTFVEVVNKKEDAKKFEEAIRKLDNARQLINSMEEKGVIVGIKEFLVVTFPLTGDPKKDLGQLSIDLPDPD